MLASYRRVFAKPGALAFSATALVARLPISMMTLGIVLLVSSVSGSYALAGQISAAYIVGNALFAIPHGRLADRFGQRLVLYADSVVFALSSSLMIVSITHEWALVWPHVWGALAGASIPQIGAMVRGRWVYILSAHSERHTAFAAESVADEVVFVTGPALVTFLSTAWAPQAGPGDGRGRRHGRRPRPGDAAPDRASGAPARPADGAEPDAVGDRWCR